MMETKDFLFNISFKLLNENGKLGAFNGQSKNFRLSIEEISFVFTIKKCQKINNSSITFQ